MDSSAASDTQPAAGGKLYASDKVYMSYVPGKGRGVFARQAIKAGETIEVCPVIVIPDDQWEIINTTDLTNYYITFGEEDCGLFNHHHKRHAAASGLTCVWWARAGIVLGFGSLYNHSSTPNSRMDRKPAERLVEFVALRDIAKDEEVTFRYQTGGQWFPI